MPDINSDKKNVRNDEIDLLDLFRRIGKTLNTWFSALFRAFLISVVFLMRRWLPLTLSVIAGIGLSYLMKSTNASFYTSDLVLRNNLVEIDQKTHEDFSGTTAELISKINKLHLFCVEKNTSALSEAISIKPETAKSINDIGAFWIIDLNRDGIPDLVDYKGTHNIYDTVNVRMQNTLDVSVNITSSLDLNHVRDGILKFIEKDSSYQQMNQLRLKQNNELLVRLTYDIKQLDSLQKVKYFEETRNAKPANSGQIVFMQERNTQLVYNDIYKLYEKKQLLEKETDLYKNIVNVISDFSTPTQRKNGLVFYAKTMIPLLFCITLLILIMIANKKKLSEIYKKY